MSSTRPKPRFTSSPEARQGLAEPRDHASPFAALALPEQPRGRIPGAIVPVEQPTPVRRVGQQNPDRLSQCAGEMRDAGVDGNDEIELRDQRRGVRKITEFSAELDHLSAFEQLTIPRANVL